MWIGKSLSANNQGLYVKCTQQKNSATFLPVFETSAKKSAAGIFIGPLLCFVAEISASWQHCYQHFLVLHEMIFEQIGKF
jgi:hypothetical protein